MKRTEPKSLQAIIEQAIADGGMSENFDLQRASSLWADIVGPEIASRTTRRYIEGTVLHIFISSAPLKNELEYQRARLTELLNNAVGRPALTNIIIH